LIKMFGLVRVSPPLGADDLEDRLEQLQKKEAEYMDDGEGRLKKEKDELEALVEREVDEDLERERKALEDYDDYYDEENDGFEDDRKEQKPQRGGAGGNRGRGGKTNDRDRDFK